MADVNEPGPHDEYLDQVFGWAERLRGMDASLLTTRYGVDPKSLEEIPSGPSSSRVVTRLLRDGEAQRLEVQQHLEGLTQEYVVDGLAHEDAVIRARQSVGDAGVLSKTLSRTTAQSVLSLDSRRLWFMRVIPYDKWVGFMALLFLAEISHLRHSDGNRLIRDCWLPYSALGYARGWMVGTTLTPESLRLVRNVTKGLAAILKLPTLNTISRRQRLSRLRLLWTRNILSNVVAASGWIEKGNPEAATVAAIADYAFRVVASMCLLLWPLSALGQVFHVSHGLMDGLWAAAFYDYSSLAGCIIGRRYRVRRQARRVS